MRCNCKFLNADGTTSYYTTGLTTHQAGCSSFDKCVWCERGMGTEFGDLHATCKPLVRQAIQGLLRWSEKAIK